MMNSVYPIYTVRTECHDCYKCVRQCPVKAIRIEEGIASVLPERCVACGKCVQVCPSHAKKVRDDLAEVQRLLNESAPVYVSLAPSWAGVFTDWNQNGIVAALKKIGFCQVSETALGAQEVSAAIATDLADQPGRVFLSSACPVAVDYVRKYYPQYADRITPLGSPAQTHGALLKSQFGPEIKTVFIGPCAAKKNEADRHPEYIDCAITFHELERLFEQGNIHAADFVNSSDEFVPQSAAEGALYPIEGGMLETIRRCGCQERIQLMAISGLELLSESLEHLASLTPQRPIFVEMLACSGGCVNGPCSHRPSELAATTEILNQVTVRDPARRHPKIRVPMEIRPDSVVENKPNDAAIREALKMTGKTTPEDELNCGGCGYDTCRNFAEALIRKDAEPSMCVSYMRKIAMRKANALLRCMPSGVAILDKDLLIVESNQAFARILGGYLPELFETVPGLSGADIRKILPAESLFKAALLYGEDIHKEHFPINNLLLDLTIFTIDPKKIIGVIIEDVTDTEMRRDEIAQRAKEVISKNISVVQEIACKLGEHMANTEILLNSIAEGYHSDRKKTQGCQDNEA